MPGQCPEVATRLAALRALQRALGDLTAPSLRGTVWEGYSPRRDPPWPPARDGVPSPEVILATLREALPSGHADLDRELGEPLARAATDALTALASRLAHWGAVIDVHAFDLEVGVGRALELAEARL